MTGLIPIDWAPGYFVREDGTIWSALCGGRWKPTHGNLRQLTPRLVAHGYVGVSLRIDGRDRKHSVHHIVCSVFHGPRPDGKEVRHLDGDKRNNVPSNLTWGTRAENVADKIKHGATTLGSKSGMARISEAQAFEIKKRLATGEHFASIAANFNVCAGTIARISRGDGWPHVPNPDGFVPAKRRGGKLSDEQVRDIRSRCAAGERHRDIAKIHGVSEGAVSLIRNRITWANVA